jgi:hypothetical protein
MDTGRYEKSANKLLDVFSDGRLTNYDLMYVAFYTAMGARTDGILDRVIEFAEHLKIERQRIKESKEYVQDSLF